MEYKFITEDRFDEVVQHLREFFFMDEPLRNGVPLKKRTQNDSKTVNYIYNTLALNLSIMAVNENNEIAGVRLNGILTKEDYKDLCKKTLESSEEDKKTSRYFLHDLNRRAKLFDKFNVDQIFELRLLSVNRRYRGKGIAKELIERSEQLARDNGFKMMKAEATGIFSQKALKSNGFLVLEEQYYDKWCDKFGNPIFEVESPHIKCQLLYKLLD